MLSRLDRLGDVPVVVMRPSPHHPPHPLPGRPFPPDVTDNRVLWDLYAQSYKAPFGAALNIHRRRSAGHRCTTSATTSWAAQRRVCAGRRRRDGRRVPHRDDALVRGAPGLPLQATSDRS
jgi:hypothetical protein